MPQGKKWGGIAFSEGKIPKVSEIQRLQFELAYFRPAVLHFSLYVTVTDPMSMNRIDMDLTHWYRLNINPSIEE